ncbi:MerR family transcriptional regulator [Viridibacillus sp. NPDC096237]|uniref:MerR family transcriptional regulator n=1 Tax=Viridibacillus sp. NPDC096237 TaxID=3390721 RepID=UPI003D06EC82
MNASDTASILNVSAPSLRAYSQLLEQNGYKIHKNANKQRQYNEHDIDIISAMLALKNRGELSLKEAAIKVSSADFSPSSTVQSIAKRKSAEQIAMTVDPFDNELYRILELMSDEMVAMRAENKALYERLAELETKQDMTLKAIEHPKESAEFKHMQDQIDTMIMHQTKLAEITPNTNALMAEIRKLNSKIAELETLATTEQTKGGFW